MKPFLSAKTLEDRKKRYLITYVNHLEGLYKAEIQKVFEWFVVKYPKRRLEWVSGMGSHFWYLDGQELDCSDYVIDFTQWKPLRGEYGCKPRQPNRILEKLAPLCDFYNSINDHTFVEIYYIDIGNFCSDDFKQPTQNP